jgi:hypothetical protein
MSKGVPSREEFEEMALRGRLHEWLERISVIPSDSELETAQSPLDLGRLYGYSEEDIAHYYWSRRRDCQTALSTCGTLRTPSYLHGPPPPTGSKANRPSGITSQAFSLSGEPVTMSIRFYTGRSRATFRSSNRPSSISSSI